MTEPVPLLEIAGLRVTVGEREVLRGIDLVVAEGETHVLLGPNGGGKTTLLNTIVGLPGYQVTAGTLRFRGVDLVPLPVDERARLGIGMAYQRPPAVRGVKLRQMLEVSAHDGISDETLDELVDELALGRLIERDVNAGYSGGETKRSEMAQLLAQQPALSLFDEPESGVDLDNIAVVGEAMNALLKGARASEPHASGLIVTHTGHILEFVNADVGHVLYGGQLACRGNPLDLIEEIRRQGYEACVECEACKRP